MSWETIVKHGSNRWDWKAAFRLLEAQLSDYMETIHTVIQYIVNIIPPEKCVRLWGLRMNMCSFPSVPVVLLSICRLAVVGTDHLYKGHFLLGFRFCFCVQSVSSISFLVSMPSIQGLNSCSKMLMKNLHERGEK